MLTWAGTEDERAPGGAITEELCGSLDHEPPCPLAAHSTSAVRREETLEVRVLFACEPADEAAVRSRIDVALARQWQLLTSGRDGSWTARPSHAARLVVS